MLYLLGGPPKCGKTSIAESLCRERGLPWLSTDTVRGVVAMLLPEFDEAGAIGSPVADEAVLFAPYFERICRSCAYLADDYLIEGVGFTPPQVLAIAEELDVRCVFVGRSAVPPDSLDTTGGRNRWEDHLDQRSRAAVPRWIEQQSAELSVLAAECGIPYFDLSDDAAARRSSAVGVLLGEEGVGRTGLQL